MNAIAFHNNDIAIIVSDPSDTEEIRNQVLACGWKPYTYRLNDGSDHTSWKTTSRDNEGDFD